MALQLYKIATVEVGSAGASSIDFTSIPQGYTDLKIVLSSRTARADTVDTVYAQFNSSTTGYSCKRLYGTGSAAGSDTPAAGATAFYLGIIDGNNATSNTFGSLECYIPNYTSANYKSASNDAVSETNATDGWQTLIAALWSSTAAITSISLKNLNANYTQYSTATLYGIL